MQAGELIDERFEIETLAGAGGMGEVYRALDRVSGERVALKVLYTVDAHHLSRFSREVQTLATLHVPRVVRYIAHGATQHGRPFLAMEWLDGELLEGRLSRQPLTVGESVALALSIADTLGELHRLGLVHRDLKPSNLMLVGGDLARATLIDFGIVRVGGFDQSLTRAGSILGTPGYMAPEQARGEAGVDARADVFSLGCLLYRCLSGRAAFEGSDGLAVMVKIILEEPPKLRELRPELPARLEQLVARMLSKSPRARPRDGIAAAAELATVEGLLTGDDLDATPLESLRTPEITTGERRVMCLVLARVADLPSEAMDQLSALARRYQGTLELIEARTPLFVLAGAGAPTDLAARAARCALALHELLGGAPTALVTGRAELSDRLPVGALVERAVQALPDGPQGRAEGAGAGASADAFGPAVRVRIDDVTAGLLATRFQLSQDATGFRIEGAREELDAASALLGKATTFVGREREIALLCSEFDRCVEESTAGVVVVTGAAGLGKSRLRYELVRAIRERAPDIEVWIGQADPMSAGSAYGLLASALCRAFDLADGEPLEVRRQKVLARVVRHARAGLAAPRVAAFLGELVGAPMPADDDVQLHAARQNPRLMRDQLRLAWLEFVSAECASRPLLIALEDLHWGDLSTVSLVEAALRHAHERPLFVVALGRPEVNELFPDLFASGGGPRISLTPLSRRASERLVREALGDAAGPDLVATLVARADGNAFFLEEEIRCVAEGKVAELPETVLAMVQARIETLDPEARRVLRAASVFGESFCESGVAALVGAMQVGPWLREIQRQEIIVRADPLRGDREGELEYRFRHALVREAAYGMLLDSDRRLGHALAGDWLERAGGASPIALAEHFERGGEAARAAAACLRAAQDALRGDDLAAAVARAERGLANSQTLEIAGALRLVQAEAHVWRSENALAIKRAMQAAELLAPGSMRWFAAFLPAAMGAGRLGAMDDIERWMARVRDTPPLGDGALVAKLSCLGEAAMYLVFGGRHQAADALIEAIEAMMAAVPRGDAEAVASLYQARAIRAQTSGDPGASLAWRQAALAVHERTGDRRNAVRARINLGFLWCELGLFDEAEEVLRVATAASEQMDLSDLAVTARQNLGLVFRYRGEIEEAIAMGRESADILGRLGHPRLEAFSRVYLADALNAAGRHEAAEIEARVATEVAGGLPPLCAYALAVQARAALGLGRAADALTAAREAHALLEQLAGLDEGESLVRLVYAETLAANERAEEAAVAFAAARESLLARAAKIADPTWRDRFLRAIPENARTLELARG